MSIYHLFQAQLTRQWRRTPLVPSTSRSISIFGLGTPTPEASSSSFDATFRTSATTTESTTKVTSNHINKRKISKEVATTYDMPLAQAERIVTMIFDTIVEGVVDGRQVRVSNFGAFDSYMSKATERKNPKTGEIVQIPSKRRIRFKAYDSFKKA